MTPQRIGLVAIEGVSWITVTLLLAFVSIVVTLSVKRAKFLYSLRNIPYPSALPVIGNAVQLNCNLEGN